MSQAFHGGRLREASAEFGLPEDSFIDFSANINVFASDVSSREWEEWRATITRYPEADASTLRDRLARVYGADPGHILPTGGAIDAIYLAARIFPGRKVGIVEPSFSDYHRAFLAAGCEPERITLPPELWHAPAAEWSHLLAPFDVVVLGNPNNPTGALQSRKPLAAMFEEPWARSKTWLIDEAFIEFVADSENETLLPLLAGNPPLLVLRSLTKSWRIPGLRLGFAATSNFAWMERLRAMQPPWSVNAVAQAWGVRFLTPENHAQLLAGLAEYPNVKRQFEAGLRQIPGLRVHPSAANFLLLELADPSLDASHLHRELGRRGLLVRVCDSFHGMEKGRFIRLAVRTQAENELLAGTLGTICGGNAREAA